MTSDRFALRAKEWDFNPRIIAMFEAFVNLYRQEIVLDSTMKLLDVGGGTGLIAFDLAPLVESVMIVDSSPAMVKVARERALGEGIGNCTIVEGDIIHTPAGSDRFDRIHAHMSMHHVADTAGAVNRYYSLLRTGGVLVIADLVKEDGSFHGDEPVPHNGFAVDGLMKLLGDAGFVNCRSLPLAGVPSSKDPSRIYDRFFLIAEKK